MTTKRWFPRTALGALTALLALGPSCATPAAPGELMMVLQTDLALPKDVDSVRLQILVRGDPRRDQLFDKLGDDGALLIPASLGVIIQDGGDPTTPVTFRVTAFRGAKPTILREVVTTVPPDRVATLRIPIQWLCQDQVTADDLGNPISTCPEGKTCVTGTCVDKVIDSTTLPLFDPAEVFGGGTGKGDGECFDAETCFVGSLDTPVNLDDCTITRTGDVNVGIRVESAGICGPAGCFIPLDAESEFGWKSGENDTIILPVAVCDRIKSGSAAGVSIASTSSSCMLKTDAFPACGPWCSAGKHPPKPGTVLPVSLVANQPHPVALEVAGGFVYWTNRGDFDAPTGAVKRMPVGGGTTTTLLAAQPFTRDLALLLDAGGNAEKLFFATSGVGGKPGVIAGIDLSNPNMPKNLGFNIPGLVAPEGIAVDGANAYFTDFGAESVLSLDLVSGTSAVIASPGIGTGQNSPYRIAMDDKTIFWVNEGKPGKLGAIMLSDRMDPTPVVAAASQDTPRSLALGLKAGTAEAIYWANFGSGEVMSASLSGTPVTAGAPVPLATGQASPHGVAIDATHVYWTNRGDGTVRKVPRGGGKAVIVAKNQVAPGAIVVEGDSVFWVNEGSSSSADGAVMRLSKGAPSL